jgi:hypothetical protein
MWILLQHWKQILLFVSVVGLYSAGYFHGKSVVQSAWDVAELERSVASKTSILATERNTLKLSSEVSNDYQLSLKTINDKYAVALDSLYKAYDTEGVPSISDPTTGRDAKTCPNRLSKKATRDIIELTKYADLQTQQLLACQAWISKMSKEFNQQE